jgi:hypothetical protein
MQSRQTASIVFRRLRACGCAARTRHRSPCCRGPPRRARRNARGTRRTCIPSTPANRPSAPGGRPAGSGRSSAHRSVGREAQAHRSTLTTRLAVKFPINPISVAILSGTASGAEFTPASTIWFGAGLRLRLGLRLRRCTNAWASSRQHSQAQVVATSLGGVHPQMAGVGLERGHPSA